MNTSPQDLINALTTIAAANPTRIVISNPKLKDSAYLRVEITQTPDGYQLAKRTEKQAFHENIAAKNLQKTLTLLINDFSQLNAFTKEAEYRLRLTKKDKVQFGKQANAVTTAPEASSKAATSSSLQHNRQKNYLLPEGTVIAPLIEMGIFTKEGKIAKPMYHKYRQINRFLEIIDDALPHEETKDNNTLHVLDFGCGKSYLTFILYHYLTQIRQMNVQMTGLDLKADVVAKCNATAKRYGYQNLQFEVGDINGYNNAGNEESATPVDMVITLHACDTATDYALFNAIQWGARMIFSAPCCQHELNAQMQSQDLSILTRYGIVQERTAALMTDAIRANLLQACGYKTQLLEFIDSEHTLKNILIRAVRTNIPQHQRHKALAEVKQLMQAFSFEPMLYKLLQTLPQSALKDTLFPLDNTNA